MIRPLRLPVLALACALLPLFAGAAFAQRSISSDPAVPDTTRAAAAEAARAAMTTLPVWSGIEDLYALQRSDWKNQEWCGTIDRLGVTLQLPSAHVGQRDWVVFSYQNEWLRSTWSTVVYDSLMMPSIARTHRTVVATMFSGRCGHDWMFGRETRPFAFVGFGLGLGYGSVGDPWSAQADSWAAYEGIARAGVYAYPWKRTRLGLMAQGVLSYRMQGNDQRGDDHQLLFGLLIEQPLAIPKRLATAD